MSVDSLAATGVTVAEVPETVSCWLDGVAYVGDIATLYVLPPNPPETVALVLVYPSDRPDTDTFPVVAAVPEIDADVGVVVIDAPDRLADVGVVVTEDEEMLAVVGVLVMDNPLAGALAVPEELPVKYATKLVGIEIVCVVGVSVTVQVLELNDADTPVSTVTVVCEAADTDTLPDGGGNEMERVPLTPVALSYVTCPVTPVARSYVTVPPEMPVALSYVTAPPEIALFGTAIAPPEMLVALSYVTVVAGGAGIVTVPVTFDTAWLMTGTVT